MAFHEVRLPARLAFGSTGGVERRTEIVTLGSGFERRSTPWAMGRRRYLIGANLRSLEDMAALTDFFEARRGRLHGFRFRDFADWRSGADERLGVGDGDQTTFQLIKRYGEGPQAVVRTIGKPVEGTVAVSVEGEVLSSDDFDVEPTTGLVTLAAAPGEGAVVSARFEFDTPVRFDADRIEVTLESFDAGRLAAVPLIEVRV